MNRLAIAVAFVVVVYTSVTGCVGTVIVDYDIAVQVTRRDQLGHTLSDNADRLSTSPRAAGIASQFPTVTYRSPLLEWQIGVGTFGLGGIVANLSDTSICFRLDQAKLASNFQTADAPLRVFSLVHTVTGKRTAFGSTDPRVHTDFTPPAVCVAPRKSGSISVGPDLSNLFPMRTMFNVSWPAGEPTLTERGIGNWLKVSLPVEYGDVSETLELKLTSKDAKARISHY